MNPNGNGNGEPILDVHDLRVWYGTGGDPVVTDRLRMIDFRSPVDDVPARFLLTSRGGRDASIVPRRIVLAHRRARREIERALRSAISRARRSVAEGVRLASSALSSWSISETIVLRSMPRAEPSSC